MRSFALIVTALTTVTISSYADVSYKVTRKISGGELAKAGSLVLDMVQKFQLLRERP